MDTEDEGTGVSCSFNSNCDSTGASEAITILSFQFAFVNNKTMLILSLNTPSHTRGVN